ncbi:MAG: ROK family protein, partial [Syntrophothermus sp.]
MNAENLITGNARVVRSINRALIINLIRTRQPISRIEISRHTGLNKSTVSSIVSDLLHEELICEKVKTDQTVGRNPVDLYLKKGRYLAGAINIDMSSTRFALVDIFGSVLATSSILTDAQKPESFIEKCLDEIDELCTLYSIDKLEGLGISIAGIVDSSAGKVNFAPNLGWEDLNIVKIIKKLRPGLRILSVGNDAKASALAEQWFGTHENALHDFVFVSIGPGIGTGIVVESKLLEGEFNASGEFGHISILNDGKECSCG